MMCRTEDRSPVGGYGVLIGDLAALNREQSVHPFHRKHGTSIQENPRPVKTGGLGEERKRATPLAHVLH